MANALSLGFGDVAEAPANKRKGGRYPSKPLTFRDAAQAAAMSQIPVVSDVGGLVADAMMYREEPESRTALNYLLTGLGVLPGVPALAGIFAGKGAKTADAVMLAKAQAMTKAGADPFDVWRETGWTDQFPDRQWRFEIDDSGAVFNRGPSGETPLTQGFGEIEIGPAFGDKNALLEHPLLAAAYDPATVAPHTRVRDSMTLLNNERGAFDPSTGTMTLFAPATVPQAKSTTLHELQHAIQQREGFARGGSPEMAFRDSRIWGKKGAAGSDVAYKMLKEKMRQMSTPLSSEEYARQAWGSDVVTPEIAEAYRGYVDSIRKALNPELIAEAQKTVASDWYRRLAGEAEARLVQNRMNWTPEMRRAVAPWQQMAADVPLDQQIVRYGDGPAMNVGPGGKITDRDVNLGKAAKESFGTTWNPDEAGYVTFGGNFLDLSGRHYATGYAKQGGAYRPTSGQDWLRGSKNVDHRELPEAVTGLLANKGDGPTDDMRQFMNQANVVRFSPGTGIDTTFVPSDMQLKAIVESWRGGPDPMYVDVTHPETGNALASFEVARPSVTKLRNLIKGALKDYQPKAEPVLSAPSADDLAAQLEAMRAANVAKGLPPETGTGDLRGEIARRNAISMLGLPEANTAADRARAMGFDTDAYHASDADILSFDNTKLGTNTSYISGGDKKAIRSAKRGHWFSDRDLTNKDKRGYMFGDVSYPVLLKDPKKIKDAEFMATSFIQKDPSRIRSRFAAFDPERRGENDLLAGLAPYAIPAGLLGLMLTRPGEEYD